MTTTNDTNDPRDPLVPDDFDLENAKNKHSTTPDDQQPRCPECGTIHIHTKTGKDQGASKRIDGDYWCGKCTAHFDDPDPPAAEVSGR